MAEPKPPQPWDAAFRRVRGVYQPECWYPPRTTAAELDEVERELNFRFPLSYRAFAQEFGLNGDLHDGLPHVLPLRLPPGVDDDHWWCALVTAVNFWRTYEWEESRWDEDSASNDLLRRLIVFAKDGSYHSWAFDPTDVTHATRREYRIYDVDRSQHATAISPTFDAWLLYIDKQYRFERDEEPGEPEFTPVYKPDSPHPDAMLYCRYTLSRLRKERPDLSDVALWLAWNNHTARDLARSVREHGRTDAFPILADALQEAGCSNDDLLNSCRTGDPDIDGAWVLQVLLGKA